MTAQRLKKKRLAPLVNVSRGHIQYIYIRPTANPNRITKRIKVVGWLYFILMKVHIEALFVIQFNEDGEMK